MSNMGKDFDLDAYLQALGREIKAHRVRHGLSREQLAALAGMSPKQVGNMERGDRGQLLEAWRVAAVFEVPLSELVAAAEGQVRRRA